MPPQRPLPMRISGNRLIKCILLTFVVTVVKIRLLRKIIGNGLLKYVADHCCIGTSCLKTVTDRTVIISTGRY
jgi:hypothetical protein